MTYSVQKEESRKVGRVKRVEQEYKLGTVECISVGESAAWEHTQLQELGDGSVL